mmetsp:Transcript_20488/g.78550  ORF Transcript_20488/g.78550 Transcript_20488/m.78550 type:complete len:390 (-) Transcript_20488:121-1290(-)
MEVDGAEDWEAALPGHAPLEEEGFVQSFAADDTEGVRQFYEKYGFVVVRDAIPEAQAEATAKELWAQICSDSAPAESLAGRAVGAVKSFLWGTPAGLDMSCPGSWGDTLEGGYWPYPGGVGIVGHGIAKTRMAWENRQAPGIHKAFATVLGTEDLIASCDRMGIMRPTFVRKPDGTPEEKPRWRTKESWWHWDMNPWFWTRAVERPEKDPKLVEQARDVLLERWARPSSAEHILITENNNVLDFHGYDKVQGVLALADSGEKDGGFTCVPGFHRVIEMWARGRDMYNNAHYVSVEGDKIGRHGQKISMRKGSIVIWSSCLPHCNFPNESERFRMCQYVKMFPAVVIADDTEMREARAAAVRSYMPDDFFPSNLGKSVFDLDARNQAIKQ